MQELSIFKKSPFVVTRDRNNKTERNLGFCPSKGDEGTRCRDEFLTQEFPKKRKKFLLKEKEGIVLVMKFTEREGHVSERSVDNMFVTMPTKKEGRERKERKRRSKKKKSPFYLK